LSWIRKLRQSLHIQPHFGFATVQRSALLLGSHLDTVRNAGKYDGMLGVVTGIEPAAGLIDPAETDWRHFNNQRENSQLSTHTRPVSACMTSGCWFKISRTQGASVIEAGMLVAVSPGALARVTRARRGYPQFGLLTMCKYRGATACRLPTATPHEPTAWQLLC